MLIDTSYFTGPLTIAQLGQKAVDDSLKSFINRFEPVIMEAALGYDFYQAFLNGLDVTSDEVIDQRWMDLLNGVLFTNANSIKKRFAGFAGGQNSQTLIASQKEDLTIYAGTTPGFPVGGYQYTNTDLAGWNFQVELFGAGTLDRGIEWNYKSGGGVTLTDTSYITSPGERWILHFTGKKITTSGSGSSPNLLSPLAAFIYYEYMKDLASQNTGIGLVKNEGENSKSADVVRKPVDAFNEGVRQIQLFWDLMQADQEKTIKVYPEFDPLQVVGYSYGCSYNWSYWRFYRGYEAYSFRFKNVYGI